MSTRAQEHKLSFFASIVLISLVCCSGVREAWAACNNPDIALATGTDPASATLAPGSGIKDGDAFTFTLSGNGNCGSTAWSVTALTVTLAASGTPYDGLAEVRITSDNGSTLYFSAVTSFSSNTVNFSGGTAISGTGITAVQFKVRITPKTHAAMPAVPGASYDLSPYVSAFTPSTPAGVTGSGTDSNANTQTIDNLSPNSATTTSGDVGNVSVTVFYTTSSSADVSKTVVLYWAAGSPGAEVPVEGTNYSVGNTIGTATVGCIKTGETVSTASKCSTTGLSNGTAYSFQVFQQDTNGNYDQNGIAASGNPFTPVDLNAQTFINLIPE